MTQPQTGRPTTRGREHHDHPDRDQHSSASVDVSTSDSPGADVDPPDSRTVPEPRTPQRRARGSHVGAPRGQAPHPSRQQAQQLSLPGMDEWVQEQLTHAPPRSRAWARRVAAIYGLELPDE